MDHTLLYELAAFLMCALLQGMVTNDVRPMQAPGEVLLPATSAMGNLNGSMTP
jgi:hypothetical protein